VRPEPWTAQYYQGASHFMDELLLGLKDTAEVTLLPRGGAQAAHYRDARFAGMRIVDTALDIADIAPDCDLFIGAGGTMTREMAVLGIPTISVYQDNLLDVDRFLLAQGAFLHLPRLTAAQALDHLDSMERRPPNLDLLERGRNAYELLKQQIVAG
jgi:predicted glycosyltransferase